MRRTVGKERDGGKGKGKGAPPPSRPPLPVLAMFALARLHLLYTGLARLLQGHLRGLRLLTLNAVLHHLPTLSLVPALRGLALMWAGCGGWVRVLCSRRLARLFHGGRFPLVRTGGRLRVSISGRRGLLRGDRRPGDRQQRQRRLDCASHHGRSPSRVDARSLTRRRLLNNRVITGDGELRPT